MAKTRCASSTFLAKALPCFSKNALQEPGNVLASQREPWLTIDPKPLVGEPADDLGQWLVNRSDRYFSTPDPLAAIREKIDMFSRKLDLEPKSIAGWAFVKSVGWEMGLRLSN